MNVLVSVDFAAHVGIGAGLAGCATAVDLRVAGLGSGGAEAMNVAADSADAR